MIDKAIEELPNNCSYKIGTITYQVAAFFDTNKPSLQEKIKRLLSEEIKNPQNHTFANSLSDSVE